MSAAVDIFLSVCRRDTYGYLLQCSTEAAHGMTLEMSEHKHGIILIHTLSDIVFLYYPAVGDVKHAVGALSIHELHIKMLRPPMFFEQIQML